MEPYANFNIYAASFLIAAIFPAFSHWLCIRDKDCHKRVVTKMLVILMLLAAVLLGVSPARAWSYPPARGIFWFIIGLLFCGVGDVLLELPPEKWFRKGLLAFLLGQVCYVLGFGCLYPAGAAPLVPVGLALALLLLGFFFVSRFMRGMRQRGLEKMRLPVVIYSICISLMFYSAAITLLDARWQRFEALLAAGGALLFFASDVVNAWGRFVKGFSNQRLVVMVTYHLGQMGIAAGVALHFYRLLQ